MPVITVTAVSGINAVDTGLVRVAEINGNFQLYDADDTNEIHAKLEALSAPTASMDVAIEIDIQ
jgi:muconolactone delta-isomerase